MKCQTLFSGKNKKNISKCRLLKILPRVLSVKYDLPVYNLQQNSVNRSHLKPLNTFQSANMFSCLFSHFKYSLIFSITVEVN